ncbi:hypothetical protein OpiT1DRAFT_03981 [Opitutaceae bacterium TAV1]|nr:hypothetical protein OpiT1DRAFT_03981 [Opitutaceae bacterium TAV1]
MTPSLRELFRHNLLSQLAAAGAVGMKPAALKLGLKAGGFDPVDQSLDDELQYLADKGLAAPMDKTISPELKRWRITAEGRDYAAQEGLS